MKRRKCGNDGIMLLNEEECYKRMRDSIMRGELLPNERLIEMDLVQSLGVGRATLRTVLARLEQEGLVQRERYRGAHVRVISESEAIEILEARAALEGVAVRYAALNATPADIDILRGHLAEMRKRLDTGDLSGYSDVNAQLHQALLRISQHATAVRLLEMLQSQLVRFQYHTSLVPGRSLVSHHEHEAIVVAVADHDPDRAEHAMRDHLSHVVEALRSTKKSSWSVKEKE